MAVLTSDQIVAQIISQLRLQDPTASAEVGTPERKIIEAVAEMIASSQVDFSVLSQQANLASLSGSNLDAYLSLFSFGRQAGTPSYGTVTFSTTSSPTTAIIIPAGAQVVANTTNSQFPTLTFVTTQTGVLDVGQTSVDVPIQCAVTGSIGNIAANTIVGFSGYQSITGITTIANAQGLTGGTDQETDAAYKTRFTNTLFRNMAGTYDQLMALCLAQNSVTKANVVGAVSRYQEFILVPSVDDSNQDTPYDSSGSIYPHKRTTAESSIPFSKYTYDTNYYVTDGTLDPSSANFFLPGVDYVFNTPPWDGTTGAVDSANPTTPDVTFLSPFGAANPDGNPLIEEGDLLLLEHAYISESSRNDFSYNIFNAVDIYVDGSNINTVSSIEIVPFASNELQDSNSSLWTYQYLGVHATDTVSASSTPGDGNTVTVNDIAYTFKTSLTGAAYEVHINGQDGSLTNLEHAINASGGTPGTDYGTGTVANPYVTAGSVATHTITLTAILVGTSANSYTLAKSGSNLAVGAGTFSGGTTPVINFKRALDGSLSGIGNYVQPLYWQPVISLPQSIQVGVDTYYLANFYDPDNGIYYNEYDGSDYHLPAHYIQVEEVNDYYGTIRSRSGIEWFLSGDNYLQGQLTSDSGDSYSGDYIDANSGTQFNVENYSYDQNVSDLQAIVEKNKQITTDPLVHSATPRYFQPLVTVAYNLGSTQSVVNLSIIATLQSFWQNQYFGAAVQMSDILQAVHNVPGVDNVRWTNPDGNKVQEVNADGSAFTSPKFFSDDFFIQDKELPYAPASNQVVITARSANTWSA